MKNKNHYFENLDGLRAIAALSVFFFHVTNWFSYPKTTFYNKVQVVFSFGGSGGILGVTFFFILSWFLITFLMFQEKQKYGNVNIGNFYVRRLLRIWPLYYLTLLIGFVIYPNLSSIIGNNYQEKANIILYLVFGTNYDHIFNAHPSTGILGVQWSVAVEEQFYLIWPILFYFVGNKKYFLYACTLLFIASEIFWLNQTDWATKYYHLFSNIRFLAFGGFCGYICFFYSEKVTSALRRLHKNTHIIIYIICLLLLLTYQKLSEINGMQIILHSLPYLFFGFVIIEQNYSINSFFKISSLKLLTYFGKISYGIYLLHMVAVYVVLNVFPKTEDLVLLKVVCSFLLTILFSHISYSYFERFFLNLKQKFSPQPI